MKIVISSGHGQYIRGAAGPYLDEVDEARRVVPRVAEYLRERGFQVIEFHDNTSTSQSQNLSTITNFHNNQGAHDLDVSVHFNAYVPTDGPRGCEVLYLTQAELAKKVSARLAKAAGFIDRGPKQRSDLAFLNNTNAPAILVETCFVDSAEDARLYNLSFDIICAALAGKAISLPDEPLQPGPSVPPPEVEALLQVRGKVSWFGGPGDKGVSSSEDLAWWEDEDDAKANPDLFLKKQPSNTTGLARRLDPQSYYVACRWDYAKTPKAMLAKPKPKALVRIPGGPGFLARPADWGPHEDTGRVADISSGLMTALGVATDDEVEVIYPAPVT
jgi:hypothetical protein